MRLIVIGCEYTGKSTLAQALHEWGQERGIRYHMDDHFALPDSQTLKDPADRRAMNEAPEAIKERFQRFQIAYHVRLLHKYENILLVGFHTEEAVYGHRYYYPGLGKSFELPQSWEKDMPGDTILAMLTARPEVVRARMESAPHDYSLVPPADVDEILEAFRVEFGRSWLQKRFQIDTSDLSPGELLPAFLDASAPYLTARDLILRTHAPETGS